MLSVPLHQADLLGSLALSLFFIAQLPALQWNLRLLRFEFECSAGTTESLLLHVVWGFQQRDPAELSVLRFGNLWSDHVLVVGVVQTPVLKILSPIGECVGRAFISEVKTSLLVQDLVGPPDALVFEFDVIAFNLNSLTKLRS